MKQLSEIIDKYAQPMDGGTQSGEKPKGGFTLMSAKDALDKWGLDLEDDVALVADLKSQGEIFVDGNTTFVLWELRHPDFKMRTCQNKEMATCIAKYILAAESVEDELKAIDEMMRDC